MDIMAEKIELVKQLLNTNDIGILISIKSILKGSNQNPNDRADLPDEVMADINESITQIEAGQGISHLEAKETYKKWL